MYWNQFRAFFKVLCLNQKRHAFWLTAEMLLPLVFSLMILLVYYKVDPIKREDVVFDRFPLYGNALDLLTVVDGLPLLLTGFNYYSLYYAPSNENTDKFMEQVQKRYMWAYTPISPLLSQQQYSKEAADLMTGVSVARYCKYHVDESVKLFKLCQLISRYELKVVSGFRNEVELVDFAVNPGNVKNYIGAIVFEELSQKKLRYKLRFRYYHRHPVPGHFSGSVAHDWNVDSILPHGFQSMATSYANLTEGGTPAYWREMFLTIQKAVDSTYIANMAAQHGSSEEAKSAEVYMQRFPFPAHQRHPMHSYSPVIMPLIFVLSFMLTVLYVTRAIATDQERGIKDYLHMVGLQPFIYWLAYFLINVLKTSLSVLTLTVVLCTMFPKTPIYLVFLTVLLYALGAICFGFMLSVAIRRGTLGTLVAAVVWFLMYLPSLYLLKTHQDMESKARTACTFIPNYGITVALQLMSLQETREAALTWKAASVGEKGQSFALVILALFVNLLVWILLAIIFHAPFRFVCLKSHSYVKEYVPKTAFSANSESMVSMAGFGVKVRDLAVVRKCGKTFILAVKDVTFNAHTHHVTVLLGRNGSGKTTILNVLAGLTSAYEGNVTIGPYNIFKDRSELVPHIGYCPQYNPLYENLTVTEHLHFYTLLKGAKRNVNHEAAMLDRLRLSDRRDFTARSLSGGMQRKLSLAIALSGHSEVVLLDEPTSGLDPEARKEVQSVLLQEKRRRLILLTTHYLEEADLLGDYVVILHRGNVIDKGTTRLLKRQFGEYVILRIHFEDCDFKNCTREVRLIIKREDIDASFDLQGRIYQVQMAAIDTSWTSISNVLQRLDDARRLLKISRMRLAITALQDVFEKKSKFIAGLMPACASATLLAMSFDSGQSNLRLLEQTISGNLSSLLPQFSFTKAVMSYYANRLMEQQVQQLNLSTDYFSDNHKFTKDYMSWDAPGIGRWLACLGVHGLVFLTLLTVLEWCQFVHFRGLMKNLQKCPINFRRANGQNSDQLPVEIRQLVAIYRKSKYSAINRLNLRLRRSSCICILGPNGAGKTTLLKVLTGQMSFPIGVVKIAGVDILQNLKKSGLQYGYCSQFDALPGQLTGLECLTLYARIRGVRKSDFHQNIDSIIVALHLQDQVFKLVKNLSGGNKRKLSLAVAVVGNPAILFLDEPTSGVDSIGRQHVCALLNHLRSVHHTSILITSHCLDVIECVSTELAVLSEGSLQYQGPLKDFTNDRAYFRLRMAASTEQGACRLHDMVLTVYPNAQNQVSANPVERQYRIAKRTASGAATWSGLLSLVENIKRSERLHDFEISETFLDDYLAFKTLQHD